MDRRHFLRTSCGMAAAFVAMNYVFGNLFDVSEAEGGDALHETFTFQWPRQFDAIPLGKGTAPPIRWLASQFDQMHGHLGGKILARDHGQVCRQGLPCAG